MTVLWWSSPGMSDPQLILDYASPRKRGSVRLPATSKLSITTDADGSARVLETLRAHPWPLFAICFGVLVTCVLLAGAARETLWLLDHRHIAADFIMPVLVAVMAVVELRLVILVIRNTWRRTILVVGTRWISLEFRGPLKRRWRREWPTDEVGEIALLPTQSEPDAVRLAELQLRPQGLLINLFTDHRAMDLEDILAQLNRARAGEPPKVVALASQPFLPPPPPDPQTLQRLRETREGLRDRLH